MGSNVWPNKDVRELVRWAEGLGYEAENTKGGHIKFVHPKVSKPIFCSSTPSEYRSLKNTESMLARAVNSIANDVRKTNKVIVDSEDEDSGGYDCPACLGNGVKRSFLYPDGLIAHMADAHPAGPAEIDEWNQPFETEQPETESVEEEDVLTGEKMHVHADELSAYLEDRRDRDELKSGDTITSKDVRDHFDNDNVYNAISALKKRRKGTRLEMGHKYTGIYIVRFAGDSAKPEPDPESDPAPKTVRLSAMFSESAIYEEINRFVDGRVLLRDAEGRLYQASIEPLT